MLIFEIRVGKRYMSAASVELAPHPKLLPLVYVGHYLGYGRPLLYLICSVRFKGGGKIWDSNFEPLDQTPRRINISLVGGYCDKI